jgi:septal ring factor EnvC (AmiA/AmiB activator)
MMEQQNQRSQVFGNLADMNESRQRDSIYHANKLSLMEILRSQQVFNENGTLTFDDSAEEAEACDTSFCYFLKLNQDLLVAPVAHLHEKYHAVRVKFRKIKFKSCEAFLVELEDASA